MTRVLIVEDSPTQAAQLALILQAEGLEVEIARDGQQGLEQCHRSRFDAVLSDVVMPGLSGYDLCRALKADPTTKNIPVVLLTSLNDPTNIIEALECGADNYITKPYDPPYLVSRLRTIIAHAHLRADRMVTAGVEILFMGRRFTITSEKEQILGLLVSTTEDIIRANRVLQATHEALREAERQRQAHSEQLARINKELEAFVYTVSHDLKEPLRGIEAFSRFLLDDYAAVLDDQGQRYLDLLRDSAIRMTQLIDDLLSFSRVGRQSTSTTRVELGALLDEVLRGLEFSIEEAGGRVVMPADPPPVVGYPLLLRQLFANLLGNAIKYRRPGVPPEVVIAWRPLSDGIEITVADNGIGVPAEQRELVFGLFQRLHRREDYPGTGVGLALCKRIVEEHQGTIGIEDTPGGGCTVRLTLHEPASAATTGAVPATSMPNAAGSGAAAQHWQEGG